MLVRGVAVQIVECSGTSQWKSVAYQQCFTSYSLITGITWGALRIYMLSIVIFLFSVRCNAFYNEEWRALPISGWSGIREIFACAIWSPRLCLQIQFKESGIPLKIRVQDPSSTDRIPKLIHSAESRIYYCLRDYLAESTTYIEGDTCIKKPKSQIIQPWMWFERTYGIEYW